MRIQLRCSSRPKFEILIWKTVNILWSTNTLMLDKDTGHRRDTPHSWCERFKAFVYTRKSLRCLGAARFHGNKFNWPHFLLLFLSKAQENHRFFERNDRRRWKMYCLQQYGERNFLWKAKSAPGDYSKNTICIRRSWFSL